MFSCCVPAYRGSCFRKAPRESFPGRLFGSHPLRCLWPFTRRSPRETQGHLGQAGPGQAPSVSHPWAAPTPHTLRSGEEGQEREDPWQGAGCWAAGSLVFLSPSHPRTGLAGWRGTSCGDSCLPVGPQGPLAVMFVALPRGGLCVSGVERVSGSEDQQRQRA